MASDIETLISTIQDEGEAAGVSRHIIAEVVRLLRADGAMLHGGPPVPRETLFNTWKTRGEMHQEQNAPIYGYAALLNEMARATEDSLRIVSVKDAESQFGIFVTPCYERLIGILYYPIRACKEFAAKRHP